MINTDFKKETFEEFLREMHHEIYPEVMDDDLPDHFECWLYDLDVAKTMEWAEVYGRQQFLAGQSHMLNTITKD